jgi:hypothetical protein
MHTDENMADIFTKALTVVRSSAEGVPVFARGTKHKGLASVVESVNTIEFDIAKTEAVPFSQKRNHQGWSVKMKVKVDEHVYVNFKSKVTRWLAVVLDRKFNFHNNHDVIMTNARNAEGKVCSITGMMGLTLENARKVQIAAVQSVALYGAELWWDRPVE